MKFGFKFSNLCGTVYRQGNLVFTADGNCLVSPVGNRVTVFDLVNNTSRTLPFENRKNIETVLLSPNGTILVTIDEDGHAILSNFRLGAVLHHHNFKSPVTVAKFSPDGRYFAVSHGKQVQVWRAPGLHKEFAPFVLHRTYTGHYDDVIALDWSPDSRFFITGSRDMTARIYSTDPIEGFSPLTLTGHRNHVVAVFFSADAEKIYTVSKDGALFVWYDVAAQTGAIGWHLEKKHFFQHNHAKVLCAAFHKASNLLTVGFSSGIFGLYELPDFNDIHTLSISQKRITAVAVNSTGEWLAFGCAKLGQLLVWEWKSESYVLKQQGHFYDMNVLAYSPDGQLVATGGDDGKVKIWNTRSGFCFVTFSEHSGGVTGVRFSNTGHAVFSSSLDGTVRAYDLIRYRNFRTFTSPSPVQFSCLAIDPASEIICAGSLDTFDIYVWSIQTGRLLEILSGHEGPVTSLAFNPMSAILCSGSWDHEIRVWDIFERKAATEAFPHTTDVRAFDFHPNGREICVATLDGQLTFWDIHNGVQTGSIECRRDIAGGRKMDDKVTAKNSASGKCFTSVCYSADGRCVLAGGRSKYVCIYEVEQKVLLKRFQISENRSLDGLLEKLNSKYMTEAGNMELISDEEASDLDDRLDKSLPGVQKGDMSKRRVRPEVRTKSVQFSPTGRAWAAATTEGLLIYSLDETMVFDPFDLDIDVTPDNVLKTLGKHEYTKAVSLAFRLNEKKLVKRVVESIPVDAISLVVQTLPAPYVDRLLLFVGAALDKTPHVEFYLTWSFHILNLHGRYLKDNSNRFMTVFRTLQKSVTQHNDDLARLCDDNTYTINFIENMARFHLAPAAEPIDADESDDEAQSEIDEMETEE